MQEECSRVKEQRERRWKQVYLTENEGQVETGRD